MIVLFLSNGRIRFLIREDLQEVGGGIAKYNDRNVMLYTDQYDGTEDYEKINGI